ncbi:hypothetical protein [Fodinicola feengrottensis]|uniref:hypothetical protein n=1 Tax=Fodinicola feengrottensis TaxID=435914 RepID=UPI0013D0AF0F|nr:hypothetical protein [Fodinicola feengrottensis]
MEKCLCRGDDPGRVVECGGARRGCHRRTERAHASPQTFKYVGSFFTYGDCEAYGYSNYNGYNNTWFCTQSNNPDTLPWSLYHEDSV